MPRILDFGLAKVTIAKSPLGSEPALATLEVDPEQLTSPGAMLGTVAYMSPAQVKAKKLDVRTDLFSFGSVPYEMGTAKTPFDGSSAGDICGLIVQQDPVPLSRV